MMKKIISFLIGDIEKWKKLPLAWQELKIDMTTNKKWKLIGIFILFFGITYGGMQGVRYIQNNAQYCTIIENPVKIMPHINILPKDLNIRMNGNITEQIKRVNDLALPLPENNKSWAYYLKYYENGRRQSWIRFNCTFDFKRFKEEILR